MGRPKEFKDREMISVTLEKEEREMLEEIRWRERLDLTEVARKAVIEYIKAHKEGNETFKLDDWEKDPTIIAVPTLFAGWEIWLKYLEDCDKDDFFKVLNALTKKRDQAIGIMNKRNLKWDESKKTRYKVDHEVTSHYVPMMRD